MILPEEKKSCLTGSNSSFFAPCHPSAPRRPAHATTSVGVGEKQRRSKSFPPITPFRPNQKHRPPTEGEITPSSPKSQRGGRARRRQSTRSPAGPRAAHSRCQRQLVGEDIAVPFPSRLAGHVPLPLTRGNHGADGAQQGVCRPLLDRAVLPVHLSRRLSGSEDQQLVRRWLSADWGVGRRPLSFPPPFHAPSGLRRCSPVAGRFFPLPQGLANCSRFQRFQRSSHSSRQNRGASSPSIPGRSNLLPSWLLKWQNRRQLLRRGQILPG